MNDKLAVYLADVAENMEMVSTESFAFYDTETGEFVHYSELYSDDCTDPSEFEQEKYICLPSCFDIHEYSIMQKFVESVEDSHKRDLLSVALEGKGAFRRFKDALYRVDLRDAWFAFKRQEFIELARDWREENEIPYRVKKPV